MYCACAYIVCVRMRARVTCKRTRTETEGGGGGEPVSSVGGLSDGIQRVCAPERPICVPTDARPKDDYLSRMC